MNVDMSRERLHNIPVRTRMLIAVIVTCVIMSFVIYIWYASFTSSLSGSFQVQGNIDEFAAHGGVPVEKDETFFGSLRSLTGDIDFTMDRFSELRASFINIFSQ